MKIYVKFSMSSNDPLIILRIFPFELKCARNYIFDTAQLLSANFEHYYSYVFQFW